MRVICSWCRTVMGSGDGPSDLRVSHGMCASCKALPESEQNRLAAMWSRLAFAYEPMFGIERDPVWLDELLVKNERAS